LEDWVERTTSKKIKMVLQREGRVNISSPQSINILGTERLPNWGVMIQIDST
jgi:hypothetical protein